MKKPNEKQIKKHLLNVDEHFHGLIDAIVYYDSKGMDDWATDIIGAIEGKSLVETFELLLSDLKNRKKSDFDAYFYCTLWLALINEQDEEITNMFIHEIKEEKNKDLQYFLSYSLEKMEKDPDPDAEFVDVDTVAYIKNILDQSI
jgi:hypothetical protein